MARQKKNGTTDNEAWETAIPEETEAPEETAEVNETEEAEIPVKSAEKYFKVRFHERTSESESENITLGVNGNILVIRRGVPVVIPESFVKTARRAVIRYRYTDTKSGKPVSRKLARCSFDILGESSETEFLKMKEEGTRKTMKALEDEAVQETDDAEEE